MASQEQQTHAPRCPAAEAAGGLVLDPPDVTRILALQQQGWGTRRIAQELGISRRTVRRYQRLGGYQPYARRQTPRALQPQIGWLKERFLAVRGNARVLLREARERGVRIEYSTLARVVKPWREELAARARATVRFETPPGQQMQADFGELRVVIAGSAMLVHFCVLTLGYSRRTFVRAFMAERQEHWLAAMEASFRHFGGVPREMLVDNAKALVTFHPHSGDVRFSEAFVAFCQLHGIAPRACRPFRARSKGKVESGVKYVKRNALAGLSFTSFEALEAHLERWSREVADVRVHGTTHERPIDRFVAEAAALLPVRTVAPMSLPLARKVAADCLVDVDTNRYSVPHAYVGRRVEVLVRDAEIAIRCDGIEIARHAQARGRHRVIDRREHYDGLWPRREPALLVEESFDAPLAHYDEVAP